jgi:hypothetical protein
MYFMACWLSQLSSCIVGEVLLVSKFAVVDDDVCQWLFPTKMVSNCGGSQLGKRSALLREPRQFDTFGGGVLTSSVLEGAAIHLSIEIRTSRICLIASMSSKSVCWKQQTVSASSKYDRTENLIVPNVEVGVSMIRFDDGITQNVHLQG